MLHLQVLCLAALLFRVMVLSPPTFHFVSTRYILLKNAHLSSSVLVLMRRVSSATNNKLGCDLVLYFVIGTRFHFVKQMFSETDVIKLKKKNKIILPSDIFAVAQWLRCCATNRKVAGSIPDCVTGIYH